MESSKVVFVSGCFDVLHGGHIEFLGQARALGTRLVVCVPTDNVIKAHKQRLPALPLEHRLSILKALACVDEVVVGDDAEPGLNFKSEFMRLKPDILAVTDDDQFVEAKRELCELVSARYVVLEKTLSYQAISSTSIRNYLLAPTIAPVRVDFGGGWLDVPKYSRPDGYIVNCAVTPGVSLSCWPYHFGGGLGGSAVGKILLGENAIAGELAAGVGWQDPAIISETGLCCWRSGPTPHLLVKVRGDSLAGHMAIWWTGKPHDTRIVASNPRDYEMIKLAGDQCEMGFCHLGRMLQFLAAGIEISYQAQLKEGMDPLPKIEYAARKYCGGGFGGYALYLFLSQDHRDNFVNNNDQAVAIEPYLKSP